MYKKVILFPPQLFWLYLMSMYKQFLNEDSHGEWVRNEAQAQWSWGSIVSLMSLRLEMKRLQSKRLAQKLEPFVVMTTHVDENCPGAGYLWCDISEIYNQLQSSFQFLLGDHPKCWARSRVPSDLREAFRLL